MEAKINKGGGGFCGGRGLCFCVGFFVCVCVCTIDSVNVYITMYNNSV